MTEYNFNFKNSIFTKQAIKAAREKAIKKDVQDSIASSNEVKNLLEQKCDNAGVFRDLTDEEVEARLKSEEQSPLSLIKNLINNKHKIDSSASPQNDAFRHTEQSEVSQNTDYSEVSQPMETGLSLPIGGLEDESVIDETANQTEFTPTPTPTPVENRANATTSLTIKDADGAKPQTLAAGDKLNVTYVYEDKTFNYTIEAKSAQNVTLQTKDGYFTVVGDNLAVQTGDEQYSFVALIGTTNSIKIGTNGKTYNGNSIAYNSDEGGHSIYTWGDDPVNPDLTLGRAGSGSEYPSSGTISLTNGEKTVLLTNPFTGENYTYKIEARDLTELSFFNSEECDYEYVAAQRENISFQFLENGRLVIRGNYLDITAGEGQRDDIILLGNFNNLNTGDEDDTIRVGLAVDTINIDDDTPLYLTEAATHTEAGKQTGNYTRINDGKGYQLSFQEKYKNADGEYPFAYCAVGNHITSGKGNDYVTMLLYQSDTVATVDMGEGTDTFLVANGRYEYDSTRLKYTDSNLYKNNNLTNAQYVNSNTFVTTTDANGNSLFDDDDGWSIQGRLNDCRFIALFNSICQVGGHKISDYVDIVKNGTNYTVTFKKYNPTTWGTTTNTINIPISEVTSDTGDAYGDIDTYIVESALNKIIGINKDRNKDSSRTVHWNTFSRYFYGNDLLTWVETYELSIDKMNDLLSKFHSGEIDNITTQIVSHDKTNGVTGGHQYTVNNLYSNNGEYYVELINPLDDRDILRLSWNKYKSLTGGICVFGKLLYGKTNEIISNGNL